MGGPLAVDSKIVSRGNNTMAKDVEPDAIHHHACGQRIGGAGDQLAELTPSAAECLKAVPVIRNELKIPSRDCLTRMRRVTGREHREIVARVEVCHTLKDLWSGNAGLGEVILFDQPF